MQQNEDTGRIYLLTGITGFLGKVLLEQLLRRREELDVEHVYVVIRPRGTLSADQRFAREVVPSACFSKLPPNWSDHVEVLEGQLEQPGLDLDATAREKITQRVTHVMHAAASVEFNLPVEKAARSNIVTSLNMLELLRSCSKLQKFVCISTAYVSPQPADGTMIEEKLAPLPRPAEEIYESILDGTANEGELLSESGLPNTYTLTKSLTEHLLVERRGNVPLTIVRPSVISASWQQPFPGWIDSTSGFASFVILLGMGHMRAVIGDFDARLDLVPVDVVAQRALLACQSAVNIDAPPIIHHVTAGVQQSPSMRECWLGIRDFYSVHRIDRRPTLHYLGPPGARFAIADALHHRLPVAMAGLRGRRARRRGNQLLSRLDSLNSVFPYFAGQTFDFQSSRTLDDDYDPRDYLTTACRGVYRHIFGRDDSEWVLAGRSHNGHGGDMRWARQQPHGSGAIRFGAWLITKVLRRCCKSVTIDVPSFEVVRRAALVGCPIVVLPSHRSFFDFVLCSYLFFARPDLRIPIPHIAAAMEFSHIPILGRLLGSLQAFYLKRGKDCDKEALSRQVHELISDGKSIEFFMEGTRSRSREFLTPKRGMLRCVQGTGEICLLLPVSLSYDRVPEEASFATELEGAPKPKMSLRGLLGWTMRMLRGRIDLGRIHVACGDLLHIGPDTDIYSISEELIEQLQNATVSTGFHLRAYLDQFPIEGVDEAWLQKEIEQRGGRVLESDLSVPEDLKPVIAATMRHQFAHLFAADTTADGPVGQLARQLFEESKDRPSENKRVA